MSHADAIRGNKPMSYSRQSVNGTVVENKDGEIYINGVHTETGKRSFESYLKFAFLSAVIFLLGVVWGAR